VPRPRRERTNARPGAIAIGSSMPLRPRPGPATASGVPELAECDRGERIGPGSTRLRRLSRAPDVGFCASGRIECSSAQSAGSPGSACRLARNMVYSAPTFSMHHLWSAGPLFGPTETRRLAAWARSFWSTDARIGFVQLSSLLTCLETSPSVAPFVERRSKAELLGPGADYSGLSGHRSVRLLPGLRSRCLDLARVVAEDERAPNGSLRLLSA